MAAVCAPCRLPLPHARALRCPQCGAPTALGRAVLSRQDAGVAAVLRRCCYDDGAAGRQLTDVLYARGIVDASGVWGWVAADWEALGATPTLARRAVTAVSSIVRAAAAMDATAGDAANAHAPLARAEEIIDDAPVASPPPPATRVGGCARKGRASHRASRAWQGVRAQRGGGEESNAQQQPQQPSADQELPGTPCVRCRMPVPDTALVCMFCARASVMRGAADLESGRMSVESVVNWGVYLAAQSGTTAAPTHPLAHQGGAPPRAAAASAWEELDDDDGPDKDTPPDASANDSRARGSWGWQRAGSSSAAGASAAMQNVELLDEDDTDDAPSPVGVADDAHPAVVQPAAGGVPQSSSSSAPPPPTSLPAPPPASAAFAAYCSLSTFADLLGSPRAAAARAPAAPAPGPPAASAAAYPFASSSSDGDSTSDGYMSARSEDEGLEELDWRGGKAGASTAPATAAAAATALSRVEVLPAQWAAARTSLHASLRERGVAVAAQLYAWAEGDFAPLLADAATAAVASGGTAPAGALRAALERCLLDGVTRSVAQARDGELCRTGGFACLPPEVLALVLGYLDAATDRVCTWKQLRLAGHAVNRTAADVPMHLTLSVAGWKPASQQQQAAASAPAVSGKRAGRTARHRRVLEDGDDGFDFGRFDAGGGQRAAGGAASRVQRSTGAPYGSRPPGRASAQGARSRSSHARRAAPTADSADAGPRVFTGALVDDALAFLGGVVPTGLTLASALADEAVPKLTSALSHTLPHLASLCLPNCGLGPAGASLLAAAVGAPDCMLTVLDVTGNRLGPDGARALATAVTASDTLATLNLGGNRADDVGAAALADMLATNASLTMLNVAFNGISPTGAEFFARGLARNKTLRALQFSGNCIKSEGFVSLLAASAAGGGLASLYLVGCGLSIGTPRRGDVPRGTAHALEFLELSDNGELGEVLDAVAHCVPRGCEVVVDTIHLGARPTWAPTDAASQRMLNRSG